MLEAQGFDERRPEIFCRDVNDVVQVVYQRYSAPRLWSSVRFYMGVGIPALTEALGRGDWLDDVGHYLSLFGRQRLSGGRWGDDGWWSLDGNVDLEEEAAELGLEERVVFTGRVAADEVALYYGLGVVSVDPRRRSVQVESSLSLKMLESLACGVPCITVDLGDMPRFVAQAGVAVRPGDAGALAEGILNVLADEGGQARMREAAEVEREGHFWDERVKAFVKVYEPLERGG